jgi:hypothetical protein
MDISENSKQIQIFISIIIFGYFGVKIVYGIFFKFYPNKYYYRNINISTTEQSGSSTVTKNVGLNAFIPGMWNNEMTDFISAIILSSIVLVFTYRVSSGIFTLDGTAHPAFVLGYLIGMLYPIIYNRYGKFLDEQLKESCTIRYMYLISLLFIMLLIIVLNYTSTDLIEKKQKISLTIYFIVIFLLIFGLVLSKKNSKNYQYITYNNQSNDGVNCNSKDKTIVQSSGDVLNITPPFASFILLFLFYYEPATITNKFLYIFLYGILLGVVISGISYYGIEYFLVKMPEKYMDSNEQFQLKEIDKPSNIQNDYNEEKKNSYIEDMKLGMVNQEETALTFIKIFKRIMIVLIAAIIIFIIYSSLVKNI